MLHLEQITEDKTMTSPRKQSVPKRLIKKQQTVDDVSDDYFSGVPFDILLKILNLVPAELLRYKYKYVCTRWYSLITNWILHDQASLIVQKPISEGQYLYTTRLLDISEHDFEVHISEQNIEIPCKGRIRSWCNELLLIADGINRGALYIFNLITKEGYSLPECLLSSQCRGHFGCKCGLVLTFDRLKGEYKVLHGELYNCEMLVSRRNSLSFDGSKWKMIKGPARIGERKHYWSDPIAVQGRYLHWDVHSPKYILSMDIVKETFKETQLPKYENSSSLSTLYQLVERNGLLCLLLPVSKERELDVWILKDFQRTVWEKLQSIRSLSYVSLPRYEFKTHPAPVTCFKRGSIIIFRKTGRQFGYFVYYLEYNRAIKLDDGVIQGNECWRV